METESRKKALQYFFDKVVGPMGFKFTPDVELKGFSARTGGDAGDQARHPILPLPAMRHDRARDMQIVCPCIPFHREHFDAIKRCWCGLFVHKDVIGPGQPAPIAAKGRGP